MGTAPVRPPNPMRHPPTVPHPPRMLRSPAWEAVGAGMLTVGFCAALLRWDPTLCWKDDFAISILPVFTDIARAWRAGEWPLLSAGSWVCGNLAGEYQYGTFSPVVNLVALFADALPVSLRMKAAVLALPHVGLLAAGGYLLARRREVGPALATVVATVGALNGWNVIWGATDWFGALAANAWLPWCWWAFEGALRPGETRFTRRILWPAGTVFLLLTGGFPYTVGMLGLLTAWLGVRTWTRTRRMLAPWPLAAGWLAGLALSAPAWLSLLEHMAGSDRARGANVVTSAWVVPWRALAGLVDPSWTTPWADFGGNLHPRPAVELAGGLVPLALLAAGWWGAGRGRRGETARRLGWDLGLTAATLVLCLLPSFGVFRWSFRWLPLFHLALALTAARASAAGRTTPVSAPGFEVAPGDPTGEGFRGGHGGRPSGGAGLWAAGLAALAWAGGGGSVARGTLGLALGWAVVERLAPGGVRRWLPAGAVLGTLWLTYTTLGTNPGVPYYPLTDNLRDPGPLAPGRLYVSLYREPYFHYTAWAGKPHGFGATLRPGATMLYQPGLRFVNGYSPIMAAGIGRRLDMETHGFIPEPAARRLVAEELGPGGLLARLGVDGLIVADPYPLEVQPPGDEWELVHTDAEGRVYHRRGPPEEDVCALEGPAAGAGAATVRTVENGRQRVSADVTTATAAATTTIRFRRPFFPGWRATLDGRALPVSANDGLFPTVDLPAGTRGRLTLFYRPRAVVLGAALALAGAGALIFTGWRWRRA